LEVQICFGTLKASTVHKTQFNVCLDSEDMDTAKNGVILYTVCLQNL